MSNDKKNLMNGSDFEELRKALQAQEGESIGELPFGEGKLVENDFFSFRIPQGYSAEFNTDDFEVICYEDDFSLTPLQITVKAEPLILVSPEEHFEELKNSILSTKGMTMELHTVDGRDFPRFHIPTLGGKQMYFPLYHTTELFSLRINFAKKVANADEITDTIIGSFAFRDFTPRIHKKAVESVCNVFELNRSKFAQGFLKGQKAVGNGDEMEALCINYANALFGCLRVLDEEVRTMKRYDLQEDDFQKLLLLGQGFCKDMAFSLTYEGETFSVPTEEAQSLVDAWNKPTK